MKTMNHLQAMTVTMILGATLAAFGCSAAPGTTGGNGTNGNGGSSGSSGNGRSAPLADGGTGDAQLPLPNPPPPPPGEPKAFCTGLDTWLTKCGSTPAAGSEATCEQSYAKYTPAQVAASETCLTTVTSCNATALQDCLRGVVLPPPPADAGPPVTCQACVDAQCSAQLKGCEANKDCVALYQCMQTAQTQQDVQTCENQSPNGVTDLQTLLQCVSGPCGTVCK